MAVLLSDSFDRADSTTSPGSPEVGGPYTAVAGTWGISAGELYMSTVATPGHLTFPAAINLDLAVTFKEAPGSSIQPGVSFRRADAQNFWYTVRQSGTSSALYRSNGGVGTQVGPAFTHGAGDRFRVIAHERMILIFVNGAQVMQVEDHWFSTAGSGAGLRSGSTTTPRFNDLLVSDVTDLPNSWGASPETSAVDLQMANSNFTLTPSLYKGRDTSAADESEIP